jgi:hypothetical protein
VLISTKGILSHSIVYIHVSRGGSRDSVDGGLSYGAIFSIIDGTNSKITFACRKKTIYTNFDVLDGHFGK